LNEFVSGPGYCEPGDRERKGQPSKGKDSCKGPVAEAVWSGETLWRMRQCETEVEGPLEPGFVSLREWHGSGGGAGSTVAPGLPCVCGVRAACLGSHWVGTEPPQEAASPGIGQPQRTGLLPSAWSHTRREGGRCGSRTRDSGSQRKVLSPDPAVREAQGLAGSSCPGTEPSVGAGEPCIPLQTRNGAALLHTSSSLGRSGSEWPSGSTWGSCLWRNPRLLCTWQ
jgi:hypothetical protein